ncbi:MAG: TIM-barrel domain-containing protein, partial [Clostridium sp.]
MSIKKYKSGNPINCYSVDLEVNCEDIVKSNDINIEDSILKLKLEDNDIVYGLGENVRGINKRGWIFESYCSDDPNHAQ